MSRPPTPTGEFVLRALGASEIAQSCDHPQLRERFEQLTEVWLEQAERSAREDQALLGTIPSSMND